MDNDPLVEAALREQLKTTYPAAEVHTHHALDNAIEQGALFCTMLAANGVR